MAGGAMMGPEHSAFTGDDSLEAAVYAERVRSLLAKGRAALVATLASAGIAVAVLWGAVPTERLLAWFAVMVALVLIRAVGWWRHQRASEHPYDARRWLRIWLTGIAVTGVLWGCAVMFLFPEHFLAGQFLVLFLIGGVIASASATTAGFLPAFVVFTVPALALTVARLTQQTERIYWAMALLMVTFAAVMTAATRTGGRALTQSMRLVLRNAQLLDELSVSRDRLAELNRDLEERVIARTQELQRVLTENENFVSVVSHELRNPLQAMKLRQEAMVDMLQTPLMDRAELTSVAASLQRQIARIERLSDDLIDARRLETGRMGYSKEPVELAQIVSESLEQLAPELSSAGAQLELSCEPGLQGFWDRTRIEQVVVNLLTNAFKYGAPPFALQAMRSGAMVRIVVHDTGPGIPENELLRIFEPFQRAAKGGAGLGLGLYISSQIVRAHQGTLRVESAMGAGASFIIELPLLDGALH